MWAGSTVEFIRPVALDVPLTRRASVADVALKSGGSGSFVRVTLLNEVSDEAGPVLRETQDLVYRAAARPQAASAEPAAAPEARPFDYARAVTPDPTLLFRFSALTFNAHRIHYDRDYAREVEGYPGLVVHGPMQAMLLADLFARQTGGRQISRFECRARRPLFDAAPFQLKGRATPDGARLWTEDDQGRVCMDAGVTTV
jgi:3-methylfumaryl-CoA hydratase